MAQGRDWMRVGVFRDGGGSMCSLGEQIGCPSCSSAGPRQPLKLSGLLSQLVKARDNLCPLLTGTQKVRWGTKCRNAQGQLLGYMSAEKQSTSVRPPLSLGDPGKDFCARTCPLKSWRLAGARFASTRELGREPVPGRRRGRRAGSG